MHFNSLKAADAPMVGTRSPPSANGNAAGHQQGDLKRTSTELVKWDGDPEKGLGGHSSPAAEASEPLSSASVNYTLVFEQLTYSVKPRRRGSKRLVILNSVSGRCESGRLMAVMGRSGAGKTTLVCSFHRLHHSILGD